MRYAADTLALAVGDDSGSRLYWALVDPGPRGVGRLQLLRERRQRAACTSSYSCEPEQADENLAIVRKVLADVQRDGITADELQQAKSKIAVAGGPRQRAADGPDAGHRRGVDVHRRVPRRGHRTGELRRRDARRHPGLPRPLPDRPSNGVAFGPPSESTAWREGPSSSGRARVDQISEPSPA